MYDTRHDLLEAMAATPDVLTGLLDGVSQEQAQQARGGDENWSVIEVLCHLRDAEQRAIERMEAMRDQDMPLLYGYDQDAWAKERNYAAQDLSATLAEFIGLRSQFIAELSALTSEQWQRPGQHEEAGQIDISSHTLHIISHSSIHAAQLARQLG